MLLLWSIVARRETAIIVAIATPSPAKPSTAVSGKVIIVVVVVLVVRTEILLLVLLRRVPVKGYICCVSRLLDGWLTVVGCVEWPGTSWTASVHDFKIYF